MLLHMRILLAAVTPSHPQHSYMELLVANTRLDLQNRRRHAHLRCCLTRRRAMWQVHRNPQSQQDQEAEQSSHLKKSIYIAWFIPVQYQKSASSSETVKSNAVEKKSVVFAMGETSPPQQKGVPTDASDSKKPSSCSSSSSSSSFKPSSALDDDLREERNLQQQALRDFGAERKENLAKIDTILYGGNGSGIRAGIVPGAAPASPKEIQPVPLRSASLRTRQCVNATAYSGWA